MGSTEPTPALKDALLAVWRQVLIDHNETVTIAGRNYPVRHTSKRGLCQVDFEIEGQSIRGVEQNPQTQSRWALMARKGAKIMQFLAAGRYISNVADGKVTFYGRPTTERRRTRAKT
jgi:hypothetical protein